MNPIGNTNAICPNCDQHLDKMPGHKKKCPHCGMFIFVRIRPGDRKRVLVTKVQVEQIEELRSIENGTHGIYMARRKRVSDETARLAKRLGREPSENEVSWSIYNQEMVEHAAQRNWGSFRMARFQMIEILRDESRLVEALEGYLELCYIDLNGPCDRNSLPDELLKEFPRWDAKHLGMLAPGILDRISKIVRKTNTSRSDIQRIFFERATKAKESLRLPVDVTQAWEQLHEALF